MLKKLHYVFLIPLIAFILTGCGLKDSTKISAKDIEEKVSSSEKSISKNKGLFLESNLVKEMDFYVKKENLLLNFDSATKDINSAKEKLKTLQELVKKDDSSDESKVISLISDIRQILLNVSKLSNYPQERINFLIQSKKEAPSLMSNAINIEAKHSIIVKTMVSLLETNKKAFPIKKDDIELKIMEIETLFNSLSKEVKNAQNEIDKDKEMDISNFVTSIKKINELDVKILNTKTSFEKKMSELNTSYTKILSDMKEQHYVIVSRVSWDEYYDFPDEHTYTYIPIEIPASLVENYDQSPDVIATYSKGLFSGLRVKMSSDLWNKLRINPTESFPSGDDESEFWINDIKSVYFHKYLIIENDKKTETDFIKVDETTFYNNEDNLGMSLISKPYGYYESETDNKPTPPGLAFVDNPKYGEWKTDSSGNSFFYYYGMYSMFNDLTGNNRYSRDYYNDYHRNYRGREGYYSGGFGTYGERNKSSRFGNSSYTKSDSYRTNSNMNRTSSTVRTAGASSRGRGPGGGGK